MQKRAAFINELGDQLLEHGEYVFTRRDAATRRFPIQVFDNSVAVGRVTLSGNAFQAETDYGTRITATALAAVEAYAANVRGGRRAASPSRRALCLMRRLNAADPETLVMSSPVSPF